MTDMPSGGEPVETLDPDMLPESMPVTVIMRRYSVHATPWLSEKWQALAVLVPLDSPPQSAPQALPIDGVDDQLRYEGLRLSLHKDQCESYYYNMLSDQPRLFVLAHPDDEERPRPFHVSASFDEAGAGMEGDELVFPVAIPPQIYRWMEAYVLIHYVPQLKYKRKLT